jgi:hypothetical protein
VPWPAVEFLAEQLGIDDASCVKKYVQRPQTSYEHAWEIRDRYGYRSFDDQGCAETFARFLDGRAWTHAEGPVALFEHAAGWLRRNRPGWRTSTSTTYARRTTPPPRQCSSTRRRRSRSRTSGVAGCSPPWTGSGLSYRCAPSTPARPEILRLQTRHHLAQRGQRPGRRHRADGGARPPARFAIHPRHFAQPRRRTATGGGDHRQRVLQRHGLRRVRDPELPLCATLRGPARPAVLARGAARPLPDGVELSPEQQAIRD